MAEIASVVAVLLLAAAAAHDISFRTIPDWVSLALLPCGAVLRLADGTLGDGVLACVAVFAASLLAWRRGWMGGGDVKLLAAATLLAAPAFAPALLARVILAGGALALLYLAGARLLSRHHRAPSPARPRGLPLLGRVIRAEAWRMRRKGPLPYGVAVAAGTIATILN